MKPRPEVPEGMKWCRRCEAVKPIAAFLLNHRMRDGIHSWCKECSADRTRQWRAEHRDEINAQRRAAYVPSPRRPHGPFEARERPCADCGTLVMTKGRARVLCDDCRAIATREHNRRKNNKRRGARYQKNYTLEQIAERDGWRCHICHRKVDPGIPRTQPRGATIDHLVPVSADGGDEPSNVALAHRSCNIRRSTGGTVQLRLAG
ncbi:MAG: hypothetical protein DRQ97_12220 [Gammaproteobacteria bacterium]|nr:MAG: hypothetical protein DRQ97_12220 [Gammaproteobacteria bacterium]